MHLRDRAVIGILSLVLIGLTGAVVAPSLLPSGPAASPTGSLPPSHIYVEGVVGSATSVSPFSAQTAAERAITALLFRGLVRLGPDDTLIGDLASSWEVDPTGTSWTFHLRPGLRWQDGVPITSEDVAFTIGALSDSGYTGPGATSWREVTATADDPLTVTLTLATPLGGFLQAATQPIAPAHLLGTFAPADLPADAFGRHPVGSGAFRLAALDDRRALLLPATFEAVASPDASILAASPPPTDSVATAAPTPRSGGPVPFLDGIEFRFFTDGDALSGAWSRGELSGAAGLPADVATRMSGAPGSRILRYPGTTLLAVTLNVRSTHPEFRDPAVRIALLEAIDRDAIVATAVGGMASRADSLIPPSSWAFDPATSKPVPFDVADAAKKLVAAGWKQGPNGGWIPKGATSALTIELLSPEATANPAAYAVADAVAADWRAIGLDVARTALSGADLVGQRLQTGNFSAAVTGTTIGLDPDLYPLLASTQASATGSNFSGIQDPGLDQLLVKARAPGTDEARKAAYVALQAKLVAGTFVLPIAFRDVLVVVKSTLTGPVPRPVGGPGDRFWDVLTWRLADGR
ncbi:MAG: peptide ABC transporter substrate-binding protein [Chloroflexi bacterium]|nr:peptide ABC transporter substrate-binding protein [Chloroflexota bacterium]